MKAAHRKELQTNALADRMGRLIETLKSGPKSTSVVAWLFVFVALVAVVGWRYLGGSNPETESSRWLSLGTATHLPDPSSASKGLDEIQAEERGSMQARAARVQLARLSLREGQENLAHADSEKRKEALGKLRKARDLYEQLTRETADIPLLQQEALMGTAKAEEALAGVAGADGDFGRAVSYYQRLAAFSLKHLGSSVAPEKAPDTMVQLVQEQMKELGQECAADDCLAAYQKLADTEPAKFVAKAASWRDQSYYGRVAAARARELLTKGDEVRRFYAEFGKLTQGEGGAIK